MRHQSLGVDEKQLRLLCDDLIPKKSIANLLHTAGATCRYDDSPDSRPLNRRAANRSQLMYQRSALVKTAWNEEMRYAQATWSDSAQSNYSGNRDPELW
jgi:hypothetical protein